MQTIWKGAISFGLVTIPVKLYSATEERGVSFHQVHAADGGRVRYKRVCEVDGEEVPYREIAKGYDLPDGDTVVLTDEDFAQLPLSSSKEIDVLQFVPMDQVDPLYFAKAYYLSADSPGAKPYALLARALAKAGKVALVKVALRSRESVALLRPKDGVLVLQTMLWPDEVRDSSAVGPPEDVELRPQEIAMAESYIETLGGDFDPSLFVDGYRAALEELVAAKTAGRAPTPATSSHVDGGKVLDLMAALQASVDAARAARDDRAGGSSGSDRAAAPAIKPVRTTGGAAGPSSPTASRGSGTSAKGSAPAAAKTSGAATAKTSGAAAAKTSTASARKPASAVAAKTASAVAAKAPSTSAKAKSTGKGASAKAAPAVGKATAAKAKPVSRAASSGEVAKSTSRARKTA